MQADAQVKTGAKRRVRCQGVQFLPARAGLLGPQISQCVEARRHSRSRKVFGCREGGGPPRLTYSATFTEIVEQSPSIVR